jgi:uncharacterized protein (DUF488 family)
MKPVIYTVGHSTHKAFYFLKLLQQHNVDTVIDVRSIAASRFQPQYIKSRLGAYLAANDIRYFHLHEEFGARQKDTSLLDEIGRVDFEKVRARPEFRRGVEFLREETKNGHNLALMCAEADPLSCHRFSMISVALKNDFHIRHILKDGSLIENAELEKLLLKKFKRKLPKVSLFEQFDLSERLEQAYRLMNDRIGYKIG